jgi:hypothetical protein
LVKAVGTYRRREVTAQQAFVLWFADEPGNTNLAALNLLLEERWNVVMASPMSGTGEQGPETPESPYPYSRAVVILQPGNASQIQKALVLWFADGPGNTNLATLNGLLAAGWNVVTLVSMSGTGEHGGETPGSPFPYSRALVILQR